MKRSYFFLFFLFFSTYDIFAQSFDPQIVSISVDTLIPNNQGRVTINYKPTKHLAVKHFKLYRYSGKNLHDLGYEIDPQKGTFTYTESQADKQSEGFTMSSVSKDNNFDDGVPVSPHYTIYLTNETYNTCTQSIRLNWTPYIGWGSELKKYYVYGKKNNTPYLLQTTVDAQKTSCIVEQIASESNYKFYIIAENNSGNRSLSNIISLSTPKKDTMHTSLLFIDSVIYNGEKVNISFNTDTSFAEIKGYSVQKSTKDEAFSEIAFLPNKGQQQRYHFSEKIALSKSSVFYQIFAIDLCGDTLANTDTVKLPTLKGKNVNNVAVLDWEKTFEEKVEEVYDVFLSINRSEFKLLDELLKKNKQNYNLTQLSSSHQGELFCFKIKSKTNLSYISEYNPKCFSLVPQIIMPNAFTPNDDGLNDLIKPQIRYADIVKYEFVVYNQAGGLVFKTNDVEKHWDGKANGKNVREGAYLYFFSFTTYSGKNYKKTGAINVIYP